MTATKEAQIRGRLFMDPLYRLTEGSRGGGAPIPVAWRPAGVTLLSNPPAEYVRADHRGMGYRGGDGSRGL